MRIACLQFSPHLGDVNNNLSRADRVLSKADPENLDLLVLPEMSFSGYNFKALRDIHPFLEPTASGISSLWARTMALKHNCHVVVGYPETADVSHKWPTAPEYYNSAIVVAADGENVANYRKSFLYYTDETWALEGKGFFADHVTGLGQVALGICMDINPYKFQTAWNEFEFAYHVLDSDANIVIVSLAWLTQEDPQVFSSMPEEPDMNTLTYWAQRLEPVIRNESSDEVIVVFCNRCGSEDDVMYAGTSAVLGIKGGEVNVYGVLGRGSKELLVVDTNEPPLAKLISTPAGGILQPIPTVGPDGVKRHTEPVKVASTNPRLDYEAIREATNSAQRAKLTEENLAASKGGKGGALKLQIPEAPMHAWKKARDLGLDIPTPEGPSPTPGHKRPSITNIDAALARRPPSRLPDSAVVLNEDYRAPKGSKLRTSTPAEEAIRITSPDPKQDSRRRSRRPPSRNAEGGRAQRPPSRNADGVGAQRPPSRNAAGVSSSRHRKEESPAHGASSRRADRNAAPKESLAELLPKLQDSPVSRKPDPSILSHWLETLPVSAALSPPPEPTFSPPPIRQTIQKIEETSPTHVCAHCGHSTPIRGEATRAHGSERSSAQSPQSGQDQPHGESPKAERQRTRPRKSTNGSAQARPEGDLGRLLLNGLPVHLVADEAEPKYEEPPSEDQGAEKAPAASKGLHRKIQAMRQEAAAIGHIRSQSASLERQPEIVAEEATNAEDQPSSIPDPTPLSFREWKPIITPKVELLREKQLVEAERPKSMVW